MVKKLPHEHTCPSTTMVDGKMASQSWVSEMVTDWLKKNPLAGAIDVKKKLQDEYHVKVNYNKAWEGRLTALNRIHGSWEGGFAMLYNFKCEVERISPGSIVEIDVERVGTNKVRFSKIFVALKPCIDEFLHGCRPYLGVDSTHLTGKYRGQLASACAIDGHNWLYPVAYGVMDSETTESWKWFLTQLKRAIGTPSGLAISSDAGKGLCAAIPSVFPYSEHRECMRHLLENFKKRFHGADVVRHMKAASKAYTAEDCQSQLERVTKLAPGALDYLEKNHKLLWCRSQFSELSKCDYENNNISECFNNWIKAYKGLHVVDLLDQIRRMIMEKFDVRRTIGDKLRCVILPNVIKDLNAISRNTGNSRVLRGGDNYAEVSGVDMNGTVWRNVVELDKKECSCRQWQLSGKPCMHAIKFICSLRGARMEDYVHEYYSLEKFRAAYAGRIPALNDKSMWHKAEIDFEVLPPHSKRPPGRPRNQRIPGCLEPNKRRRQCKRCKGFGHQAKTCKEDDPEAAAAKMSRKRRRGAQEAT